MNKKTNTIWRFRYLLLVVFAWTLIIAVIPVMFVSASGTLSVTGLGYSNSGKGAWVYNGSTATLTIASTAGTCGATNEATATLTLTNNSGAEALLSFDVSSTNSPTYKINTSSEKEGANQFTLANGSSVAITITSNSNNTSDCTFTIYNINLVATGNISVTFSPADGYPYTVNGTPVSTTAVTLSGKIGDDFVIDAVADGYYCAYATWTNTSGGSGTLGVDANQSVSPSNETTVTPVFVYDANGRAPFIIGSVPYWTWESAFNAVSTNGTVVLNDNYTLPAASDAGVLTQNGFTGATTVNYAGNYVTYTAATATSAATIEYKIPSGVTFHIPADDAHTGLATGDGGQVYPQMVSIADSYIPTANKPSLYAYGTLTVPSNTTVSSEGTVIVSGSQFATTFRVTGSACNAYGLIKLQDQTSKIYVQSGALFCYGYITGDGTVEAEDGATIYELMQLADWRGFTAALSWLGKEVDTSNIFGILANIGTILGNLKLPDAQMTYRSFVFSQYYVQNVEANLQLNVGATLNTALSMNAKTTEMQCIVPFITDINGGGFLRLDGHGYLTRSYDENNDHITYTANCDAATGSIDVEVAMLGSSVPLDTQYNILALNSNLSIVVNSGYTLNIQSDMKLLPGATIDVKTGGNLVFDDCEFYIYDKTDWTSGAYTYGADLWQLGYVASKNGAPANRSITKSANINVDGTLTVMEDAYLFTTNLNTNSDKVLTGAGEFINYSTYTKDGAAYSGYLDEFTQDSSNWVVEHIISTTPVLGNLAGVGELQSFSTGTYYGLGSDYNNYWYQTKDVTLPTCTKGYTTYNCSDGAGLTFPLDDVDPIGHVDRDSDNICDGCVHELWFSLAGANVKLGDSLTMFFYVKSENSMDGYYVQIRRSYADGKNDEVLRIPLADWEKYNDTLNRVGYSGLAAKEMCDAISVTVYNSAGNQVSFVWEDSIRNYAMRILESTSDTKTQTVLVDMLNYGAAAQDYFDDYNIDNPANALLSEDQKAYATQEPTYSEGASNEVTGTKYVGTSISLKSNILLTFYFQDIDPSMNAIVTYTDHNGDEYNVGIKGGDFYRREDNLFGIDVPGLKVADGYIKVTCTVYDASNTVVATATDSIEGYIARNNDSDGIYLKIMKFITSAYNYFHQEALQ